MLNARTLVRICCQISVSGSEVLSVSLSGDIVLLSGDDFTVSSGPFSVYHRGKAADEAEVCLHFQLQRLFSHSTLPGGFI